MRFTDLLRAGAHLSIAAATILAAATVAFGMSEQRTTAVAISAGWWVLCMVGAIAAGWKGETSRAVSRLLVDAMPLRGLPELTPVRTTLNRMWPLALALAVALIGASWIGPQVAGIASGIALASAVMWWVQVGAVVAVEERDGVVYYVKPTGPLRPIKLLRGPGLRRDLPVDPAAPEAGLRRLGSGAGGEAG